MVMDKLREEFEEWVMNISSGCAELSLTIHDTYDSWDVERYWEAWQASRASIVVVLPDTSDIQCQECADDALLRCEKRIRSIGLSIKG